MKILVFGPGGQVGREVCRAAWPPRYAILPLDRKAIDITDSAGVDAGECADASDDLHGDGGGRADGSGGAGGEGDYCVRRIIRLVSFWFLLPCTQGRRLG